MKKRSPFYAGTYNFDGEIFESEYCLVEDRLRAIKEMDVETLKRVLAMPKSQVQMIVLSAAERRLKKLLRQK